MESRVRMLSLWSRWSPIVTVLGRWSIIWATGESHTSRQPIAAVEAAEAAMDCTSARVSHAAPRSRV